MTRRLAKRNYLIFRKTSGRRCRTPFYWKWKRDSTILPCFYTTLDYLLSGSVYPRFARDIVFNAMLSCFKKQIPPTHNIWVRQIPLSQKTLLISKLISPTQFWMILPKSSTIKHIQNRQHSCNAVLIYSLHCWNQLLIQTISHQMNAEKNNSSCM